jgi:hypothetical protein
METHEWRIKRGAEQYRRRISWVDVVQLAGLPMMGGRRFDDRNPEKGGAGHLAIDDSTALLTEVDRLMLFILFLFQV